jgi:hypothetical protein
VSLTQNGVWIPTNAGNQSLVYGSLLPLGHASRVASTEYTFIGHQADMGPTGTTFGVDGTTPIALRLVLQYTPSLVSATSDIVCVTYDTATQKWVPLEGAQPGDALRYSGTQPYLTCDVTHFSTFAGAIPTPAVASGGSMPDWSVVALVVALCLITGLGLANFSWRRRRAKAKANGTVSHRGMVLYAPLNARAMAAGLVAPRGRV